MTVTELFGLLAHRWRVVAAALVLSLAVAGAVSFLATPTYVSTARVFVGTKVQTTGNLYAAATFGATRVKSYAALGTSQPVLTSVVHRLRLKEKPADLADNIDSTQVPETVLIEITATGDSARSAQRLARAEAAALTNYISGLETKPASGVQAKVVSQATLPDAPTSPRTLLNFAAALAIGLLLGIGAAVGLEAMDRRRYDDYVIDHEVEEDPQDDEPVTRAEPDLEPEVSIPEQNGVSTTHQP